MGLAEMKADTDQILSEWGETLTRKRLAATYDDDGRATNTYTNTTTFTGDWQPTSGKVKLMEQGLEIKYDALVIAAFDASVEEDDQIFRADGTFMRVKSISKYEDHMTIFLTRTKGE